MNDSEKRGVNQTENRHTDNNGQRSGFLFLDMQDASQIPAIVEPWFLAFNASIEIHPVMVPGDLAKAGSAIEAAVKKYS